MTGGRRLETVVADTSALVSLAVPRADETTATDALPNPLHYLLTSCHVSVPMTVVAELEDLAQYQDIHGAAAHNVLAADEHIDIEDPFARDGTLDARPVLGLDEGETDGIVVANARDVDGFLTDEFGGTNVPLIHAALRGPRIVPTPRLLWDLARNEHMTNSDACVLIDVIPPQCSWENSPYVAQICDRLDATSQG